MSLNDTPSGIRFTVAVFGKRNAGKSSLINAVTGQQVSIVSEYKGTTTDAVYKNMEILPAGPVTLIDTAGFDDEGDLGELRKKRTLELLDKIDFAILVIDSGEGKSEQDDEFIKLLKSKNLKYIIVYNKSDFTRLNENTDENTLHVSAKNSYNIERLKEMIAEAGLKKENKFIVSDLINEGDIVILVIPIDSSAPKGRIILPQQQVLRELLDKNAIIISVQPGELETALNHLKKKPALVITDSQAFKKVNDILPLDIDLTSFSMLFARFKGVFYPAIKGVKALKELKENDTLLIAEGCTHHRQCEDIGTVKLPAMIKSYTGKNLNFEFSSGKDFPDDLSKYKMIICCGSCMLNEKEVLYRYKLAEKNNIPVSNYGIAIAEINGILERSSAVFK